MTRYLLSVQDAMISIKTAQNGLPLEDVRRILCTCITSVVLAVKSVLLWLLKVKLLKKV